MPDKVLKAVHPNAGIRIEYERRLRKLILDMQASIVYWVTASYRSTGLAQDATPSNELQQTMNELAKQWQTKFDRGAEKLGAWFAQKTKNYADGSLQAILKEAGFSVQFKMTAEVEDVFQAIVHEQVGLIKSIASQHLQEVQGLVMRSVQEGRNLKTLSDELMKRYGVTKRRAALIARDQNNKAIATITRTRQQLLGITEAIWIHSHAGKHPRLSHVAANGKKYNVAEGMLIDGKRIWPGTEINCRCVARSIIPGF